MLRVGASGMRHLPFRRIGADGRFTAHLCRAVLNGFHDIHVTGAAAKGARNAAPDLRLRWTGIHCEKRLRAHEHARRAATTLQAMLLQEALLDRLASFPLCHSLN